MATEMRAPAVARYVLSMRVLGLMYAGAALFFFFLPDAVFYLLNFLPKFFGVLTVIPDSSEQFWLPLATSMMVMLTLLAFGAASAPENRMLAYVHMASKLCSSAGYLYLFVFRAPMFAYLVGVITDLPIFCYVFWITLQASRALAKQPEQPAP